MLILASGSPRRRELLGGLIKEFAVIPSREEERTEESAPERIVCELARKKAESVFRTHPSDCVLGADTVVAFQGEILGKPKDAEEAKRMLRALAGQTHSVFTGVCLIANGIETVICEESKVKLASLSEGDIERYVSGGSPLDKAGAYGIQDEGIVESYEGSYSNVMGLPVETVKGLLRQAEVI